MKLCSYCCHDLKMIIFYWGHAWLIITRVMALWQIFKSKSCLCNSFCSFHWILMIPSNNCSHDLKRTLLYHSHAWLPFTRVMALAIITIENLVNTISWGPLELGFWYLAYGLGLYDLNNFWAYSMKNSLSYALFTTGIIAVEKPCQHDMSPMPATPPPPPPPPPPKQKNFFFQILCQNSLTYELKIRAVGFKVIHKFWKVECTTCFTFV